MLGECRTVDHSLVAVWTVLPSIVTSTNSGSAQVSSAVAHVASFAHVGLESEHAIGETASGLSSSNKKRRIRTKMREFNDDVLERMSYATSWERYIGGHIVSKSSLRFITTLLTATAASKPEQSDDSSEDSAVEAW